MTVAYGSGGQMISDLQAPLRTLVESSPGIAGVVFADLDGQAIATYPEKLSGTLAHCAVFSGIALRRLTVAERLAGRAVVREINLKGSEGTLTATVVPPNQLVVLHSEAHLSARSRPGIRAVVEKLQSVS